MTSTPENPPAFPNTGNSTWGLRPETGMSLRDWFAGHAAVAIMPLAYHAIAAQHGADVKDDQAMPMIAEKAYAFADAMLAAREQSK